MTNETKQRTEIEVVQDWFDELCKLVEQYPVPADVEDWIVKGADHFDDLKAAQNAHWLDSMIEKFGLGPEGSK